MTPTEKRWAWIAAGVAAVAAVWGLSKRSSAAALPPPPPPAPSPFTSNATWMTGTKYIVLMPVPQNTSDIITLTKNLVAAGWPDAQVLYFGPTGTTVGGPIPSQFKPGPNDFVATGTWQGSDNTPVPAWVQSVGAQVQ